MRELLRSAEGMITREDFRKGAKFLLLLTIGAFAILYGISVLSHAMEWMTVAIAPFFGVLVIFVVFSLVYFWYCVFAKRSRATGHSLMLIYGWLAAIFLASTFRLLDYQNRTLALSDTGLLPYAGFAALVLSILAVLLFVGLLARNWTAE
ncbi:MAG: hypothetical protein WBC71_07920 [Salaquimonas sp.]